MKCECPNDNHIGKHVSHLQTTVFKKKKSQAFNPNTPTQEAEAGGTRGQPGLQSEFQDSQGYTEKPCLEKQQQQKTKTFS